MSYPIEIKIALVREYEQGKKVAEVSKTSGIPENSIYRWIREYHTIKTASSSFTPVEYYTAVQANMPPLKSTRP